MIAGIEMACDVKLKSILGAARSKVNDSTEASLVASMNNTRSLLLISSASSSRS